MDQEQVNKYIAEKKHEIRDLDVQIYEISNELDVKVAERAGLQTVVEHLEQPKPERKFN